MIEQAKIKYAALDYDEKELVRVQQEVAKKYGKDYCVLSAAEALHILAMVATEDHCANTGTLNPERIKAMAGFVGTAINAGAKQAGFTKEELVVICAEIIGLVHD